MEIDACQSERGRDQRRCRLAVGSEADAVLVELRVVLPRAPCEENLAQVGLRDTELLRVLGQSRRDLDDRADIEVAVRPTVEAAPDAAHERIIDGGVT